MRYEAVHPVPIGDVESGTLDGMPDELSRSLIAIDLHEPDAARAQALCVRLSHHPDEVVHGNALLALGHLARRFGLLDEGSVRPAVEAGLTDASKFVCGQADAAADDLGHFLGWRIRRPGGPA